MNKKVCVNIRVQIPFMKLVCNRSGREHGTRSRIKNGVFGHSGRRQSLDTVYVDASKQRLTDYRNNQRACMVVLATKKKKKLGPNKPTRNGTLLTLSFGRLFKETRVVHQRLLSEHCVPFNEILDIINVLCRSLAMPFLHFYYLGR